jgi:alpha-tubulin suppressor-like RCC1 family protein
MKKNVLTFTVCLLMLALCVTLLPIGASANGGSSKPGVLPTDALGGSHSAAILANGDLYVWGANADGQLGLGDSTPRDTPTKVPGLSNVKAVSLGYEFSAALTANGDLYTWGLNDEGQLGLGDLTKRNTPTKVTSLSNVIAISMGEKYGSAITANGDLYTWGLGNTNQTGYGEYVPHQAVPRKVAGLSNVSAVCLNYEHSAAITANGDLYTWGLIGDGQLGDGNFGQFGSETSRNKPTKVAGLSNVAAVGLGSGNSAAVTANGDLYTWGGNSNGQLGLGNKNRVNTPTKVAGISNVTAVSMGDHNYTMAITANGDLYTWGDSGYSGMLGHGAAYDSFTAPKKVESLSKVVAIHAAGGHAVALTADGKLYIWGGGNGLGLGDTVYIQLEPTVVLEGVMLTKTASSGAVTPPADNAQTATPTAATVLVDGKKVGFDAYNIGGNNYFKLRDIAQAINGSAKQFEVGWDASANAITLSSNQAYTPAGGELQSGSAGSKQATPTTSKIYLDGKEVQLTAYNIGGNNYFKLRDLGQAFDFGVGWDAASSTITIDTKESYKE